MYSLIAEAMGGVLRGLRLEFQAEVLGNLVKLVLEVPAGSRMVLEMCQRRFSLKFRSWENSKGLLRFWMFGGNREVLGRGKFQVKLRGGSG